jgi:uncharacterized membrane-anchored protein
VLDKSNPRARLSIVSGLFCLAILVGMLVSHAWPLWTGEFIYVRVPYPVDPRAPFRGDYVILGYEFDNFSLLPPGVEPRSGEPGAMVEESAQPDDEARRQPVSLELPAVGEWWKETTQHGGDVFSWPAQKMRGTVLCLQFEAVTGAHPAVPVVHEPISVSDQIVEGKVNLCGHVRWFGRTRDSDDAVKIAELRMHFGLDAFYVQEGTGKPIERALRERRPVFAKVAVTSAGRGRLSDLIIDGEPVLHKAR